MVYIYIYIELSTKFRMLQGDSPISTCLDFPKKVRLCTDSPLCSSGMPRLFFATPREVLRQTEFPSSADFFVFENRLWARRAWKEKIDIEVWVCNTFFFKGVCLVEREKMVSSLTKFFCR